MGFDNEATGGGGEPDANEVPRTPPPSNGLIAYWDFETSTAAGVPSVMSGDMAECSGSECAPQAAGIVGSGLSFDGSRCYHVPSLMGWDTTAFTISAWVRLTSNSVDQPVVMRSSGGCHSPSLRTHADTLGFLTYDTSDAHQYAWTSSGVTAGRWQHLAVRWDGTAQSVFIDGQCSCSNTPALPIVVAANSEFALGCDAVDGRQFRGQLDEVRIYDRALTDDEMPTLAGIGSGQAPPASSCAAACAVTDALP
jgi:hypothetical protein